MVTIPVPVLTIPTHQPSTMEKEILTTAVMENFAQTALFPNQSRVTKVESAAHRALQNDKLLLISIYQGAGPLHAMEY